MGKKGAIEWKCDCEVIHEDLVEKVQSKMLSKQDQEKLTTLFKVFGDKTRLSILCALEQEELCVCDLSALLGMTISAVSHQLKVLREARLVKFRKEGKVVFYSLDDDHVKTIFDQGLIHMRELEEEA